MRVVKTAEDRKNEILDVAGKLFSVKGYDNTSTNDIIEEIGIARGTLYHHFKSKEDILDAMIQRTTYQLMARAEYIINDKSIPILDRLTQAVLSMNVESEIEAEMKEQMHKPQNALLHQKMQDTLMKGVVPLIASLIKEGVDAGMFDTAFPEEAAEMIMLYSNVAFDDNKELTSQQQQLKGMAFIYHTERILGGQPGVLQEAIMKILMKQQ